MVGVVVGLARRTLDPAGCRGGGNGAVVSDAGRPSALAGYPGAAAALHAVCVSMVTAEMPIQAVVAVVAGAFRWPSGNTRFQPQRHARETRQPVRLSRCRRRAIRRQRADGSGGNAPPGGGVGRLPVGDNPHAPGATLLHG